jgi:hypothetical protein
LCSEAYLAEARSREEIQVLGGLTRLAFDTEGNLVPPPHGP